MYRIVYFSNILAIFLSLLRMNLHHIYMFFLLPPWWLQPWNLLLFTARLLDKCLPDNFIEAAFASFPARDVSCKMKQIYASKPVIHRVHMEAYGDVLESFAIAYEPVWVVWALSGSPACIFCILHQVHCLLHVNESIQCRYPLRFLTHQQWMIARNKEWIYLSPISASLTENEEEEGSCKRYHNGIDHFQEGWIWDEEEREDAIRLHVERTSRIYVACA